MERNKKIDFIRGFSIITVVIGHCIQFGSGPNAGNCLENNVFKFIYSFHMPLFMLLSGYLFYFTCKKRSFLQNVASRFTSLFIPIIMWNIIPFIMYTWHDRPHTFGYLFKTYISTMMANSWFLWAIFYCSFAVLIVNHFFKDSPVIYLIGLVLTFVIPDSHNLFLYKFMYPYFVIGYFYHKNSYIINEKYPVPLNDTKLLVSSAAIFAALLCFFNTDSYIYTTKYTLLGREVLPQLGIDIYRFTIGLFGSIFIITLLLKLYPKLNENITKVFSIIGIHSLGIYMISGLLFHYVLPALTSWIAHINYLIIVIEAVIILGISYLISLCIKQFTITNILFFGGRK